MYLLQQMIYSGEYHAEDMVRGHSYLSGAVEGQYSAADHTRHLMQLSLAANRLVGPNFSREVVGRMTSSEGAYARREHPSPQQHQSERSEEQGNPDDKKGKKSEKKKEDYKREEDPKKKRDRKHEDKRPGR